MKPAEHCITTTGQKTAPDRESGGLEPARVITEGHFHSGIQFLRPYNEG